MARIKLDIPDTLPFETHMRLRQSDMNHGGHLGNDRVMTLMNEARAEYFASMGYTELDADGVAFIVSDAAIVFKAEGFYGQSIRAEVGPHDFGNKGFDLVYRFWVSGGDISGEKILAEAKTGQVCFDYDARKVVRLPEKLRKRLEGEK